MKRTVRVARTVHEKAHDRFGEQRSAKGAPSEYDFVSGPFAAATGFGIVYALIGGPTGVFGAGAATNPSGFAGSSDRNLFRTAIAVGIVF